MVKKGNPKKNKHLLLEDRKEIEECLDKRMTFKAIGKLIQKDPTTVSYEVKHHRCEHRNSFVREEGCPDKNTKNTNSAPFFCRSAAVMTKFESLWSIFGAFKWLFLIILSSFILLFQESIY